MKYSVVVRTYNEECHIGRLLTGLLEQTVQASEIIIVDSGSTDATLSIASRFPVKIVHINKEEFSFGRSLNFGCAQACSEIILIASAHVYPIYRNWTELMLASFDNPKVGLVYGGQCGDEFSSYSEKCIMRKWFPKVENCIQDHTFCNNGNSAIRKDLWNKFKYDESLTGLEDLAWAKEITEAGYKIAYQQKAEVVHVHDQNSKQITNRYYREALALKKVYPHERFGKRDFIYLLFSNIFSDLLFSIKDKVFLKSFVEILKFRYCQFVGTFKGFYEGNLDMDSLKDKFYYPHSIRAEEHIHDFDEDVRIDYSDIHEEIGVGS